MFAGILQNFFFIQAIGAVALIFSVLAWNAKSRSGILKQQSISGVIFIFHYLLLFAYTGAVMSVAVVARNLIFNQKHKKQWASHKSWLYIFMILLGVGGALSWQGWISALPVVGLIVGTYAMWQNDQWHLRYYIFASCIIWLPYTITVHSYSGTASQLVTMVAIIIAHYRLRGKMGEVEKL